MGEQNSTEFKQWLDSCCVPVSGHAPSVVGEGGLRRPLRVDVPYKYRRVGTQLVKTLSQLQGHI